MGRKEIMTLVSQTRIEMKVVRTCPTFSLSSWSKHYFFSLVLYVFFRRYILSHDDIILESDGYTYGHRLMATVIVCFSTTTNAVIAQLRWPLVRRGIRSLGHVLKLIHTSTNVTSYLRASRSLDHYPSLVRLELLSRDYAVLGIQWLIKILVIT